MKALLAQTRAEVTMTLRRGETLLLTLGIPLLLLVFFSEVRILPTPGIASVDLVTPGILALAIMSTSMVSLGIATGFERGYGVLERLGVTPLGRGRLLAAKMLAIVAIEVLQALCIVGVGLLLGWHPTGLYLVLLLLGGMVVPLSSLPVGIRSVAEVLPAAALSSTLHEAIGPVSGYTGCWIVLVVWGLGAPLLAVATFRFRGD